MTKMKVVLKAAPGVFVPGRHACCFVRWMLCLKHIWSIEPDLSEDGDQHLIDSTLAEVAALTCHLEEEDDFTPEYDAYRRTLILCNAVLVGLIESPPLESYWDFQMGNLRRGIYMSPAAVKRWEKEDRATIRRQKEEVERRGRGARA